MKSRVALLVVCCLSLSACATMSRLWPFGKKVKPGPEAVTELNLVNADGTPATYPQYWQRNTLVIDLSGVSGTGTVAARLPEGSTWPVRVAVRVRPGSVQQLDIQGEERNVLPVSGQGVKNIDIDMAPSLYTPRTAAIYINWGQMPVFAEAPPEVDPGFVSPTQLPPGTPPATETPEGGANQIIPPAEVAPQPSPGS